MKMRKKELEKVSNVLRILKYDILAIFDKNAQSNLGYYQDQESSNLKLEWSTDGVKIFFKFKNDESLPFIEIKTMKKIENLFINKYNTEIDLCVNPIGIDILFCEPDV